MSQPLQIEHQPDEVTCGPTCLHAIYRHHGLTVDIPSVVKSVQMLKTGGTLAPLLGADALQRGLQAEIYSFNLKIFDPTWFTLPRADLIKKLYLQASVFSSKKRYRASDAYIKFLEKGGTMKFGDLTIDLMRQLLREGPVLMGLSSTFFYKCMRENPRTCALDDINGEPSGHFVVGAGLDEAQEQVRIADPFFPNALSKTSTYFAPIEHVICSILLGVMTYDANLLIIKRPA